LNEQDSVVEKNQKNNDFEDISLQSHDNFDNYYHSNNINNTEKIKLKSNNNMKKNLKLHEQLNFREMVFFYYLFIFIFIIFNYSN
jgi:hypothetical protein